ncbi:PREDICTED: probable serine hydrolase isoform X2 [Vollenhovia emeryi]|uniref:probable serine hydrolase isoform X2 n=1 Tax=Vollenhovia emeryi TaxID=411798 RepID=UPI0005F48D3F|nr:PREDICTED: probable serine hydrolase isoform X2 [Vollenhovia emeryi]
MITKSLHFARKQVTRRTFPPSRTDSPPSARDTPVDTREIRRSYRVPIGNRHADMDVKERKSSAESATNGYKREDFKEVQIPMPWGHIRGKWWGPADKQPVVAIHGWQDNSGTFDGLAQLLPNVALLSVDLPGHGLSSHLPPGQFYYIFWDGVVVLRRIVKYYKWNKVKLLGHSLGGAISFLYAASYPDEVDAIISLDIASPYVRDVKKMAPLTGEYIDKFLKYELLTLDNMPCYEHDEMLDIVENAYNGSITKEGAEILMKRGMQPYEKDKYYFSRDPRLKVSFLGILSLDLVLEYASQIKCAYLNIRAVPGMKFEQPENYMKVLDIIKLGARKFEYHEVKGTHHVHLNEPEKLAPIIKNFLQD